MPLSALEMCAGAGGQSLGIERARFSHRALVELDGHACKTLIHNRPNWNVVRSDLNSFDTKPYKGVDLVCGGLPCPPFRRQVSSWVKTMKEICFPLRFRIIREVRTADGNPRVLKKGRAFAGVLFVLSEQALLNRS